MDGVSIVAAIEGRAFDRGHQYWHYPHGPVYEAPSYQGTAFVSSVRKGDWKLLFFYDDRHYELYKVSSDIGESTDLMGTSLQAKREAHQRSRALCDYLAAVNAHLGNIAFRTSDKVYWDGKSMTFADNAKANALLTPEYRAPWVLPSV